MGKQLNAFIAVGEEISQYELDNDGILKSNYCEVWFDYDRKEIKGKGLGKYKGFSLHTTGKRDILKSWHDVVLAFDFINMTLEDVKAITSKYGFTSLSSM